MPLSQAFIEPLSPAAVESSAVCKHFLPIPSCSEKERETGAPNTTIGNGRLKIPKRLCICKYHLQYHANSTGVYGCHTTSICLPTTQAYTVAVPPTISCMLTAQVYTVAVPPAISCQPDRRIRWPYHKHFLASSQQQAYNNYYGD